jgi:hypothetical protein
MDESNGGPTFIVPIGALVAVVVVVLVVLRMRRPSQEERALAPIVNAINDSDLPDAAKDILRESVNQVRNALHSIRTMATELARD